MSLTFTICLRGNPSTVYNLQLKQSCSLGNPLLSFYTPGFRDLGKEDAFRDSDIDPALIETIVNFLDSEEVSLEIKAAQSLAGLARSETARKLIGFASALSRQMQSLHHSMKNCCWGILASVSHSA